ncbi:MAG TPA: ergothioneine biosynthesis protein EgtB [Gemmatimonadaceae bacterium]|nr:ergothioneine biosynthesis protein EgtB [Gemmatimonadaceae bacterium]
MPIDVSEMNAAAQCRAILEEARERTLTLLAPLDEAELREQHDPLMSPVLWDLGHIAHFEELWLTRNLTGEIRFGEMPGLFNPFEHPRSERGDLPLPTLEGTLAVLADVRRRVLERLDGHSLDEDQPLQRGGYVYRMVAQHEYQHNETILQTLQLKRGAPYRAPRTWTLPGAPPGFDAGAMVRFPGGEVQIGTDDRSAAYDNERPRHEIMLPPFRIDVAPVSNADFAEFIAAGGYVRPELWSDAGRAWLAESGAQAPKYWRRDGTHWVTHSMDLQLTVPLDHPVCHVCHHEAAAFARWAGKRLPTEMEWETAASWSPEHGAKRDFPWGNEPPPDPSRANVDQLAFGTAPAGAFPAGASAMGCYGLIGDVWEWTSSDFVPWPGFAPFPYREYSAPFFGSEYKVLRGGSWATRPGAIRNTFRNWDYPIRRQIFSGFRCARDD